MIVIMIPDNDNDILTFVGLEILVIIRIAYNSDYDHDDDGHDDHNHYKQTVLDKSLDLEKFSKRSNSWFSLLSWRNEFSCLVLLSIFKILKTETEKISLSPLGSQDFCIELLFLLSIFKIL